MTNPLKTESTPEPSWLQEFEESPEAKRLDRIAADLELVNELRLRGFDNNDFGWQLFAEVLVRYGFQVLITWIRNGTIFAKIRARDQLQLYMAHHPRFDSFREIDAEALALDTVGEAIVTFRKEVLVPGLWNPEKGASLKTYFVGQCLYQFIRVYGQWAQQETERQACAYDFDESGSNTMNVMNPADIAVSRASLAEASKSLDPLTLAIFELKAMGFKQDEIAKELKISVGQVESRLYRQRQKIAKRPNI